MSKDSTVKSFFSESRRLVWDGRKFYRNGFVRRKANDSSGCRFPYVTGVRYRIADSVSRDCKIGGRHFPYRWMLFLSSNSMYCLPKLQWRLGGTTRNSSRMFLKEEHPGFFYAQARMRKFTADAVCGPRSEQGKRNPPTQLHTGPIRETWKTGKEAGKWKEFTGYIKKQWVL